MRRLILLQGIVLFFLIGGGIFPLSCGTNNNPTSPGGPSAPTATPADTATVTFTPITTVAFNWALALWSGNSDPAASFILVDLQVNGSPLTTAAVQVAGGGVTLNVPFYSSPVTQNTFVCANYRLYSASFTPGTTYVFSTTALGQTASATVVGPQHVSLVTDTTGPYNGAVTYVSWGGTFTDGTVFLQETSPVTGPDNFSGFNAGTTSMTIPLGVPATVFGYNAPAPSTYTLQTVIRNTAPAPGYYATVIMSNLTSQSLTLH